MRDQSLLAAIGTTPLIKIPTDLNSSLFAKLEYTNPGGSIKDRIALYIIAEAERHDILKRNGTVIEASTGNQAIATAMIAAIKGYKAILSVDQKISNEKLQTIKAYGAQVIKCPSTLSFDAPQSYYSQAVAIARTLPHSFMVNQYYNQSNLEAHYATTGPEVWHQTEGRITHLFAAAETGGTVAGVGKFLKEQNSRIQIIAVDSAYSYRATQGNPQPSALEGIGVDFASPFCTTEYIDDFITVTDGEAFSTATWLSINKGILASPSSGAVMHAVNKYAPALRKEDYCVMIFGDAGTAYLSKLKVHQAVKQYRDRRKAIRAQNHHTS